MDRKRSSIGTAAYVTSTLIVAFGLGAFAAWAQSKLEPADRETMYLIAAPWVVPEQQDREQMAVGAGTAHPRGPPVPESRPGARPASFDP